MMKQIRLLLYPLLLLAFASCSQDDDGYDTTPQSGEGIQFAIGFAGQDGRGLKAATDLEFNSTWETGDEVGVFAVKKDGDPADASHVVKHLKLTRQDDGSWLPDDALYYPIADPVLDFYAYYPYNNTYTCPDDVKNHEIKTNQQTTNSTTRCDLLLATAKAQSGTMVNLSFSHALAMVQVRPDRGKFVPIYTNEKKETYEFKAILKNMKTGIGSIDWDNLKANVDDAAPTADIIMDTIPYSLRLYHYRAQIPSQKVEQGDSLFHFVQELFGQKIDFTYKAVAGQTFSPAEVSKYIVKLDYQLDTDHIYSVGDPFPYKGAPIGIVYEISDGGKHGKVVSLDEELFLWSFRVEYHECFDENNGLVNMKAIAQNIDLSKIDLKAYNWVHKRNPVGEIYDDPTATDLWYVPAKKELITLYNVYSADKIAFNNKLKAAGGLAINDAYPYCSSTKNDHTQIWVTDFRNGVTSLKKFNDRVFIRLIKRF